MVVGFLYLSWLQAVQPQQQRITVKERSFVKLLCFGSDVIVNSFD
jgi:hypothetical protein